MRIDTIPALADNYIYIVSDNGRAVVIDPSETAPVLEVLRNNNVLPDAVFISHHHGDHYAGVRELARLTGCIIYGPSGGVVERAVDGGETVRAGQMNIRVMNTPGHTLDHVCYFMPDGKAVFTGDTMFVGGCGRLFGGNAGQMWQSLNAIAALGDDVQVYCGHEYTVENMDFAYSIEPGNTEVERRRGEVRELRRRNRPTVPSVIAREKLTNPFLRAADSSLKKALDMDGASDIEVFAELRKRKDRF